VFEDEVSAEQTNNNEQGGQFSIVSDRGLSDDEYNNGVLESGCEREGEDDGSKTKFSTFKMSDNMRDYKFEVGTYFVFKKEFQEGIRMYAIHSGRALMFKKNDQRIVRVICKDSCNWEAYCAKIPNEEIW